MQGEEDAESIPAVKGLICRMMPNSLLGRREILSSKRPRAFTKASQTSCTLETFTAASWVTFSMGVFEIQGEVDPFSVLGAKLCLVFLPCNIFPVRFLFTSLGQSQALGVFPPCPKRVASPELLVFMSVNRFPKLPSQNNI